MNKNHYNDCISCKRTSWGGGRLSFAGDWMYGLLTCGLYISNVSINVDMSGKWPNVDTPENPNN